VSIWRYGRCIHPRRQRWCPVEPECLSFRISAVLTSQKWTAFPGCPPMRAVPWTHSFESRVSLQFLLKWKRQQNRQVARNRGLYWLELNQRMGYFEIPDGCGHRRRGAIWPRRRPPGTHGWLIYNILFSIMLRPFQNKKERFTPNQYGNFLQSRDKAFYWGESSVAVTWGMNTGLNPLSTRGVLDESAIRQVLALPLLYFFPSFCASLFPRVFLAGCGESSFATQDAIP